MPAVLTAFWNGREKFKKKQKKMENLRIVSLYATRLWGKIINLQYGNYFKNMFSEMSYHVWRSMAFKPNDQSHGHIHDIVNSHDTIFHTSLHLGITNNVAKGSFHFLCKKNPFSIFWVPQMSFFVKDLPYICCKIAPNKFYKILWHI